METAAQLVPEDTSHQAHKSEVQCDIANNKTDAQPQQQPNTDWSFATYFPVKIQLSTFQKQNALTACFCIAPFICIHVLIQDNTTIFPILPYLVMCASALPVQCIFLMLLTCNYITEEQSHSHILVQVIQTLYYTGVPLIVATLTQERWIVALASFAIAWPTYCLWDNSSLPTELVKIKLPILVYTFTTLCFLYKPTIWPTITAMIAFVLGTCSFIYDSTNLSGWGRPLTATFCTMYSVAVCGVAHQHAHSA